MTRLKYTIFNNLYLLILVIIITSDRLFHLSMPYFILGLILFVAALIYQYRFFYPSHPNYNPKNYRITKMGWATTAVGCLIILLLILFSSGSIWIWPAFLIAFLIRDYFSTLK
ncbi:hypothetical protein [Latilactobacillus curvatus]|uniref:hypothetical protein n=1 Tax=Latilactobacillus curvatus TaxID=28038 RepID=UPI000FECC84F|nr:hypothetical protein [Latilactobacillus curvatus]QAR34902.1 hypothetical protein EQK21_02045 [Latilactobacillus curvatus]